MGKLGVLFPTWEVLPSRRVLVRASVFVSDLRVVVVVVVVVLVKDHSIDQSPSVLSLSL